MESQSADENGSVDPTTALAAEPRTTFLDYDARRAPKTDHYCVRCQKDIKPGQRHRVVHVIAGGSRILHPADEELYRPDKGDMGYFKLGSDCARKIGLEWSIDPDAR